MKRHLTLALIVVSTTIVFPLISKAQSNLIDVVYLKKGSIIKGIIVEQVPGQTVKLQASDGSIFVFEASEIEKMTREVQATINPAPSSTASAAIKRDEWGRTYNQNMEFAKHRKQASIAFMTTGSILLVGGTTFIILSTDPALRSGAVSGYLYGGIITAAAGVPFLTLGGALWSAQLRYRGRAQNMTGGTTQLNPALILTETFSDLRIHTGSAVGIQLSYQF